MTDILIMHLHLWRPIPENRKPEKRQKDWIPVWNRETAEGKRKKRITPLFFSAKVPIGLGYRVPLIIASPWSRGGYVNSEVFDHTSTLQFLEKFLSAKTGKPIKDPNISDWRRTVSGDLTSVFSSSDDNTDSVNPDFLKKDVFMESVYNAKFKKLPDDFKVLDPEEISVFKKNPYASPFMPNRKKA